MEYSVVVVMEYSVVVKTWNMLVYVISYFWEVCGSFLQYSVVTKNVEFLETMFGRLMANV